MMTTARAARVALLLLICGGCGSVQDRGVDDQALPAGSGGETVGSGGSDSAGGSGGELSTDQSSGGSVSSCPVGWSGDCAGLTFGTELCPSSRSRIFSDGVSFRCATVSPGEYDCADADSAVALRCAELQDGAGAGGSGSSGSGGAVSTGGAGPGSGGESTGGQPQNSGGSSGCVMNTWCKDADSDGYVDPNNCIESCFEGSESAESPLYDGYLRGQFSSGEDCYDQNNYASPGLNHQSFFAEDRGDGSFDYDCDGVEEPAPYGIGSCAVLGVPDRSGWSGSIPACGQPGQMITIVDGHCASTTLASTAACR